MAGRFCVHLIFLFFLSAAQNFTETKQNDLENDTVGEDEEVQETTISTVSTPDPCHCSPITYGKDEMSGELKSPGYPNTYCHNLNCTFEIEPHPDRVIRLSAESMNMEDEVDFLHLYQYVVINSTKRLIYYRDLNVGTEEANVAAKGVGFYLLMITDYSVGGTFRLAFERVLPEQSSIQCPYPFLYAKNEPQTIKADLWPAGGCSFGVFSLTPIFVRSRCSSYYDNWNVQIYHPGTRNITLSEEINIDYRIKDTFDSFDVRIFSGSTRRDYQLMEACELNFQITNSNACVCPKSRKMEIGESVNISSPGYPFLTCPDLECYTTLESKDAPVGYKTGFTIFAVHSPKSYDKLKIKVDTGRSDNSIISASDYQDPVMNEPFIVTGKQLKISYIARAVFEKDHGFTMTVEAVSIPVDCLCSSNAPKELLTDGSYSFKVPAHCEVMTCRYIIRATSDYNKMLFRLQTRYIFPNEDEYLSIQSYDTVHRYESFGSITVRKRLNIVTTSGLRILYRRNVKNGTLPSSVSMTWEWLSSRDCACHDGLQKAKEEWMDIYSPRYPNDDYCLNSRCVYFLEAPEGHHVEMNVTFFETEPHSDFVTFFDGNDTTKRHILQLNGHVLIAPIVESTGRNATVVFTSDNSVTARGFSIAFRAVPNEDFFDRSPPTSGKIYAVFHIFLICIIVVAIGYLIFIKRRHNSFKHPVYIPNIRYSVSRDNEEFIQQS